MAKLAQATGQWAAYTALRAVRERDAGATIPPFDGRRLVYDTTAALASRGGKVDADFDSFAFASEARRRFAARLFITGSTAMGTHSRGADIDAVLVLPGAGSSYDEWFGQLVSYLRAVMAAGQPQTKGSADRSDDDDDEENEEDESDGDNDDNAWLHGVIPTPPTSKVPIIRLRCSDPDPSDDEDEEDAEDGSAKQRLFFDVEFGIAVVRGFDKVPTKEELTGVRDGGNNTEDNEGEDTEGAATALIRDCCRGDVRSILSLDGLHSCTALAEQHFPRAANAVNDDDEEAYEEDADDEDYTREDPFADALRTALRFVKAWAAARGVHGTAFGFPSGIGWALLLTRTAQAYPLLSATGLLLRFFDTYGRRLVESLRRAQQSSVFGGGASASSFETPIFVNKTRPQMTPADEAALGVASWDPARRQRDASALLPVLLPTAPYRNVCDKLTPSTAAVLAEEMGRAAALLRRSAVGVAERGMGAAAVREGLAAVLRGPSQESAASSSYSSNKNISAYSVVAVVHVSTGRNAVATAITSSTDTTSATSTNACFYSSDAAKVQWALRQNIIEASLPTLVNALDGVGTGAGGSALGAGMRCRPISRRFVSGEEGEAVGGNTNSSSSSGAATCHHFILIEKRGGGFIDSAAVDRKLQRAKAAFEHQLSGHSTNSANNSNSSATSTATTAPFWLDISVNDPKSLPPFAAAAVAPFLVRGEGDATETAAVADAVSQLFSSASAAADTSTATVVGSEESAGAASCHAVPAPSEREQRKAAKQAAKEERKAACAAKAEADAKRGRAAKPLAVAKPRAAHPPETYVYSGPRLSPSEFMPFTRTALVLLPPREWWPALNSFRASEMDFSSSSSSSLPPRRPADRSYPRWMPHATLLFPFVQPQHMAEAIRSINAHFRLTETATARIDSSSNSTAAVAGDEASAAAAPTVAPGASAFDSACNGNGDKKDDRRRLVTPFSFDVSTIGTFDHGGGSAVVFVAPKEEEKGEAGAKQQHQQQQSQVLYKELQQLFPRCGRTPLIGGASQRGASAAATGGGGVSASAESLAFTPHVTLARTTCDAETTSFVAHAEATWPAEALANPAAATYTAAAARRSRNGSVRPTAAPHPTTPLRWDVAEFHLIAHLSGTEGHQIIHTFRL